MRRFTLLLLLLVLFSTACNWSVQTFTPTTEVVPTSSQLETPTETQSPATPQTLEGPDINYNGIRFTLDPAIGSRLYVFDDVIALDGAEVH